MSYAPASIMCAARDKRKTAHYWGGASSGFASPANLRKLVSAASRFSILAAEKCQHVYPSPRRPVPSLDRPVPRMRKYVGGKMTAIEYHLILAIAFSVSRAILGCAKKLNESREICKRHHSFWPQWLFLDSQVALRATLNVALQAQAQAWSHPKCWVLTVPVQFLLAQPQACFATTQASTAASNVNMRATAARRYEMNRRPGFTPAAIFCFGDGN